MTGCTISHSFRYDYHVTTYEADPLPLPHEVP